MTGLLLLVITVTALAFYAGFMVSNPIFKRRAQAGFIIGLGLVGLVAYFAWREYRTVSELAEIVDPVPQITEVTYLPDPGELQALARAMGAVPGETLTGNTQAQRRGLAQQMEHMHARYWLFKTALGPEEVVDFYAVQEHRPGWSITTQKASWIIMNGDAGRLIIFVKSDRPRSGTRVFYIYDSP